MVRLDTITPADPATVALIDEVRRLRVHVINGFRKGTVSEAEAAELLGIDRETLRLFQPPVKKMGRPPGKAKSPKKAAVAPAPAPEADGTGRVLVRDRVLDVANALSMAATPAPWGKLIAAMLGLTEGAVHRHVSTLKKLGQWPFPTGRAPKAPVPVSKKRGRPRKGVAAETTNGVPAPAPVTA